MSIEQRGKRTSVGDDKDWRGITDAGERRRAQNRIAQRNYRRNIKLRQQHSDEIDHTSGSCSRDPTKLHVSKGHSAVLHASSRNVSLESLRKNITADSQVSASHDICWPDELVTPHFSELGIGAGDLDAFPLIPSTPESNAAAQEISETGYLAHSMILDNDFNSVNSLITQPLISPNSTPLNALQKAIIQGQIDVAKLLAENGANVHVIDNNGNNILHLAVQSGKTALVLFALRNRINVNDTNMMGHTGLHIAIEQGNLDIIQLLLGAGADMELKS